MDPNWLRLTRPVAARRLRVVWWLAAAQEVAGQPEHDEGADDGPDQAAPVEDSVSPMPSPRVKMT